LRTDRTSFSVWAGRTSRSFSGPSSGRIISSRGVANQMPPIATNLVDEVNDALVAAWIDRMPAPSRLDAGPPDAADLDASVGDGAVPADAAAVLRAACVTFRE
jgi:hypothetical protein